MKISRAAIVSILLVVSGALYASKARAQDADGDGDKKDSATLKFSGLVDAYYSCDIGARGPRTAPYLFNYTRNNEVDINIMLLQAEYTTGKIRLLAALQAGSYAQYNYEGEQAPLRNMNQAYAGIRLGRRAWLDAGVLPSYLGAESLFPKDNWCLTRGLGAENSPYYLSGARITHSSKNERWDFTGLVINGWQRIRDNNRGKAIGAQVQYHVGKKLLLNSSTFAGQENPDTARAMRYFHNFFFKYNISSHWGIMGGYDQGLQQRVGKSGYSSWSSAMAILRYKFSERYSLSGRAEYFYDPEEVMLITPTGQGYNAAGASLNFDYSPYKNILFRAEGKWYDAGSSIYDKEGKLSDLNVIATVSISVTF